MSHELFGVFPKIASQISITSESTHIISLESTRAKERQEKREI